MTPVEHEKYARELLQALADNTEAKGPSAVANPRRTRNAAKAMEAIICHRLSKEAGGRPTQKAGTSRNDTTYDWEQGTFNSRNIADRPYAWTNLWRNVEKRMYESAQSRPVAYLLAFSCPSEATLGVWAIPEPLVHDRLANLPPKKNGKGYYVEISPDKQRIHKCSTSPDMTPYFRSSAFRRMRPRSWPKRANWMPRASDREKGEKRRTSRSLRGD